MMNSISLSAAPHAVTPPQRTTQFVVDVARHEVKYAEIVRRTGEVVWRWPAETPKGMGVEPKGQVVDVRA